MNEYKFSPLLFVQKDGKPIEFYMRSCSEKARLEPLIEKGGAALHSYYRPGRVRLVEPGSKVMNLKDEEETISVQYVYDCIKRNRRLDKDKYRVTLKSMETSDISEDSGSIGGDSGALSIRSKRPREELLKRQVTTKIRKFAKVTLERVSRFMLENEVDFTSLSDMEFCKKLSRLLKRSLLEVSICYDHMWKNVDHLPLDGDVLVQLQALFEKKIGKDFSRDDDLMILSYIFVNVCGSDSVCHNVWEAMRSEKDFLQPARSLWYRFNKVILPDISGYGLAPFKVQEILSKVEFLSVFDKDCNDKYCEVESLESYCPSLENGESFNKKARLEECERVIDAKLDSKNANKSPLKKNSEAAVNGSSRSPVKNVSSANGPCIINLCGRFDNVSVAEALKKIPVVTLTDVMKGKENAVQPPNKDVISPTCISETPEVEIDLEVPKDPALQTSVTPKPVSQSSSDGSVVPPTYLQSQSKRTDSQETKTPVSSQNVTTSLNDALINTGGFMPSYENETENSRHVDAATDARNRSGFDPSQDGFPPSFDQNKLNTAQDIVLSENNHDASNIPLSVDQNTAEKAPSTTSLPLSSDKVPLIVNIMALDHSPSNHSDLTPSVKKCVPLGVSPSENAENDVQLTVDRDEGEASQKTNRNKVSTPKFTVKEMVLKDAVDNVAKKHKVNKKKISAAKEKTRKKSSVNINVASTIDHNVLNEASNSSSDSHMDDLEGVKRFVSLNFGTQNKVVAAEREKLEPVSEASPKSQCAKDGELEIVKQFLQDNFGKIEDISKKLIAATATTTTTTTSSSDDQSQFTLTSSEGEASETGDKARKLNKMLMQNTKYFEPLLDMTSKTASAKIAELRKLLMQDTRDFDPIEANADNGQSPDKHENFENLNTLLMQNTGGFDPVMSNNQSSLMAKTPNKVTDDTANYETPECSLSLPGSNDSSADQLDSPKIHVAERSHKKRPSRSSKELRLESVSPATSGFRTADETICNDNIAAAANDLTPTPPRNEERLLPESENAFRSPSPSVVRQGFPLGVNTSMEVHPPLSTLSSDASTKAMDEEDEFDMTFPSSRNTLNAGSQPVAVQSEHDQDYPVSEIDPFASTGSQHTVCSMSTKAEMPIEKDREILNEAVSIVKSLNNIVSSLNKNTSKNVPASIKKQIEELSCKSFLPILKMQVREIANKRGRLTLEDKAVLVKYFSLSRQTPYHQLMCDVVNGL